MNGSTLAFVSFIICLVFVTSSLTYIIRRQQRNIDDLTDRLMARSFTEYKSADKIKEDDVSPVRDDDEPKGWYDH